MLPPFSTSSFSIDINYKTFDVCTVPSFGSGPWTSPSSALYSQASGIAAAALEVIVPSFTGSIGSSCNANFGITVGFGGYAAAGISG